MLNKISGELYLFWLCKVMTGNEDPSTLIVGASLFENKPHHSAIQNAELYFRFQTPKGRVTDSRKSWPALTLHCQFEMAGGIFRFTSCCKLVYNYNIFNVSVVKMRRDSKGIGVKRMSLFILTPRLLGRFYSFTIILT